MIIENSSSIEQHLLNNDIDLGLIEIQPEHGEMAAEPFMEDFLCAIVSVKHPLTQYKEITLEQMAQYPFLMREKGSAGREILDAAFNVRQITVHPLWESSSTQAIVRGVAEDLGVAVLPFLLVKKNIDEHNVCMIPLKPSLRRNLYMIWHKSKYLTKNMEVFIQLCKKYGCQNHIAHLK